MALPLILWGVAAALAGTGVVKGVKAKEMFNEAEEIGKRAENYYRRVNDRLQKERDKTNKALEDLGLLKVSIFKNQIQHLIDVIRKSKQSSSNLSNFEQSISMDELREMEALVLNSLEIEKGLGAGGTTGALAALGAYGGVGALATASTGTAIAGLSGAAATNATLAWLGGGALSAGGFGMAGGALALGGIVLGPALAVGGFMMASKAEEALTKAHEYDADIGIKIKEMEKAEIVLSAIRKNSVELVTALLGVSKRFDAIKTDSDHDRTAFNNMMVIGKNLKSLLDISIMHDDGQAVKNIKTKISGFLTI